MGLPLRAFSSGTFDRGLSQTEARSPNRFSSQLCVRWIGSEEESRTALGEKCCDATGVANIAVNIVPTMVAKVGREASILCVC